MRMQAALAVLAIGACLAPALGQARYFGKDLGALSELHHGVKGRVYAVDSRTLFIKDLHYDGEGPAAYFYVGSSKSPSASGGLRLRDERGGTGPLRRYRGEGVTLSLPDGKTLKDVKWFSIWCDEFSVNFGDVSIPRELDFPKPAKVGALRGVHGVSSDPVVVVDAQTLLVPNFSYDGEAPDAKFWVGRGDKPSPQGIRIPDENGKEAPLRKYDRKTIVLTLPGELTVFDIGHFAVWCEAFTVNFGHVTLPRNQLANVPPSLKMLGVSPQSRNNALVADTPRRTSHPRHRPRPAHVDATTYRPARLGLGAPGLAALLEQQPEDHVGQLHRRADDYKPAKEQLVAIQPSKEIYYRTEISQDQQNYNQQQNYQQRLPDYTQQNYNQQQNYQNQQTHQRLPQQQQSQDYRQQHFNQDPRQAAYYQQLAQQQYQLQDPNQYERQVYEQQRAAYERQLQEELYRRQQYQQQEPLQYRLYPQQ
ncbi:protein Skeletor, isoforms B/C isoform X3 [Amyelois transitella]|uniref:protein Skeletor, isoforms B/C isoform X3 n=1 Tax=Amyelois transitella TaxID=680683 RepID=UPI00298F5880|nr:protein Skeletor, isoforms B/C isoform X3 [Amyelois transitella]